jgi:DNA-binding transcriptional LysR family regulator
LWKAVSYEREKKHAEDQGERLRLALEVPNSRSMFQVVRHHIGVAIDDRVLASWWAWRREEDGDLIVALTPLKSYKDRPDLTATVEAAIDADREASKHVRGELRGLYRIHSTAPAACRVTLVLQGKMAGQVPKIALDRKVKQSLG